jgi:hypothetical protein
MFEVLGEKRERKRERERYIERVGWWEMGERAMEKKKSCKESYFERQIWLREVF